MEKETKKYNPTLAFLWETKGGHYRGMPLDTKGYDKLKDCMKDVGLNDRLFIRRLSDDQRKRFRNPEKAPHAVLEILPEGTFSGTSEESEKITF